MTPGKTNDDSRTHRQGGRPTDERPRRQDEPPDCSRPHRRRDLPDDPLAALTSPASAGATESASAGGANAGGTAVGATGEARTDETRTDGTPGSPDDTARFALLAVLPAIATLAGVALGAVVGFGVFDTRTPGVGRAVAYALLVPYFLLGVAGTQWLYEDATRLTAASADWQPNPWYYVLGGGVVLELYYLVPVLSGAGPRTGVVAYLAGGFVLALALSSVVAGPVYAFQRRRHLDSFRLRDAVPAAPTWLAVPTRLRR